ncbi:hypothetical protein HYT57_01995 [Candidatus Woesearchaeota archaeon]|nr:hypothetical protein [Candidatus Woesearchaeota archaeon]
MRRDEKIIKKVLEILLGQSLNKDKRYMETIEFYKALVSNGISKDEFDSMKHLLKGDTLSESLITEVTRREGDNPNIIRINEKVGILYLEKLEQKERDEKRDELQLELKKIQSQQKNSNIGLTIAFILVTLFVGYLSWSVGMNQVAISGMQTKISERSSLSVEPNIRVWTEGIQPIIVNAEGLIKPNEEEAQIGTSLRLCMRNLALAELDSINFNLKEKDTFDSNGGVIYNLGIEKQCTDMRIRQKGCDWGTLTKCDADKFEEGKVYTTPILLYGEDKYWLYNLDICVYKENPEPCYEKKRGNIILLN